MDEADNLVPVAPLLVTVASVIGVTSAVWFILWQQHDATHQQQLSELNTQLEQRAASADELQRQYRDSKAALAVSRDLRAELDEQLAHNRQQLQQLEEANWPQRYARLQSENVALNKRLQALTDELSSVHEEAQQRHTELQANYRDLEEAFINLELDHDALQNRFSQAHQSARQEQISLQIALTEAEQQQRTATDQKDILARDLVTAEIDQSINSSRLRSRIATLMDEQQAIRSRLAELRTRNEILLAEQEKVRNEAEQKAVANVEPPLETLTLEPPPESASAASPATTSADNSFRMARLLSLKTALADTSPPDRGAILLAVLPTIPDGIRGRELAELLDELPAIDIARVIEGSQRHIQRPLDESSIEHISARIANADQRRNIVQLLQ